MARRYRVTTSGCALRNPRLVMTSSWGNGISYCVGSARIVKPAFLARLKNSGVRIVASTLRLVRAERRVLVPPIWRVYRFVPVLKDMPVPAMPQVIVSPHNRSKVAA